VQTDVVTADQVIGTLQSAGISRGGLVAVTMVTGIGLGVAAGDSTQAVQCDEPGVLIAAIEQALRPRWVWWSNEVGSALLATGTRVATCWDLAAVHRLLFGGWRTSPAQIWAALRDLDVATVPASGQLDLLGHVGDDGGDPADPVRTDGHLRPEWADGGWRRSPERIARWAATALQAQRLQEERIAGLRVGGDLAATARSESAADLLCAELTADGLPIDVDRAAQIIASFAGPRPRDAAHAREIRSERDARVLELIPGHSLDLRSPAQVKAMLERIGIEVPDTRSWRLEVFRDAHPVIGALLAWRKNERYASTFGYDWIETHVGPDRRLRGTWFGCDGGAGRMTVQAGLHSMPADLRPAVAAEPGQVLARADLGQIEPRILAAVSADPALAAAASEADLYAPVAQRLGVERSVAKVAVLAAMYGQTSGAAGEALKGLESAYPIAMRYLRTAYEAGRAGRSVRTHGGRLLTMWPTPAGPTEQDERANVASRGRYARNAVIQGAAAEFFKAWAVTVRARGAPLGAQIVMCLHDELLVQCPHDQGAAVAALLTDCLTETAARWQPWEPRRQVRFVADVSLINRWSEAKA
jgi:DNA polymerase-1